MNSEQITFRLFIVTMLQVKVNEVKRNCVIWRCLRRAVRECSQSAQSCTCAYVTLGRKREKANPMGAKEILSDTLRHVTCLRCLHQLNLYIAA